MAKGDYKTILPIAAQRIREAALAGFQATATEVADRIIDRTPVKTGRARGNTLMLVNTADFDVDMDRLDPDGSGAKATAASVAVNLELGQTAVIGNGLAYVALGLEYGTSQQAPEGMYGITKEEVPGIYEKEMKGALERI